MAQNVSPAVDRAQTTDQSDYSGAVGEPNGVPDQTVAYGDGECGDCGCSTGCDNPCEFGCSSPDRLWVRAEYLMWWGKAASLPPLVTTGPLSSTTSTAGVLGQSGTRTLFGGDSVELGVRSGGRFNVGFWFDECQGTAIEATYLFLGSKSVNFDQSSPGDPILAIPFYNTQTAAEDSILVAYPSEKSGSAYVDFSNELHSADVLFRQCLIEQCCEHLDFLIGYRYARFNETLNIAQSSTFLSPVGDIREGTMQDVADTFAATNEFHGIELGFATRSRHDRWTLELLTKLALGSMQSHVSINGSTVTTVPGETPVTATGGLFALPTNTGDHGRTNLAVIPEFGATIGYDLTCQLRATFGYTFLYLSQVARPGDHLDRNVNPTQFPGETPSGVPAPQFNFCTTDFWAQGMNFGLDYRF